MTDLSSLITRLEAGRGADDDLNAEIFLWLHPGWRRQPWKKGARRHAWFNAHGEIEWSAHVEDWVGSIDACVALVERALPGWSYQITEWDGVMCELHNPLSSTTYMGKPYGRLNSIGKAATAPRAILIALLSAIRAKEAQDND